VNTACHESNRPTTLNGGWQVLSSATHSGAAALPRPRRQYALPPSRLPSSLLISAPTTAAKSPAFPTASGSPITARESPALRCILTAPAATPLRCCPAPSHLNGRAVLARHDEILELSAPLHVAGVSAQAQAQGADEGGLAAAAGQAQTTDRSRRRVRGPAQRKNAWFRQRLLELQLWRSCWWGSTPRNYRRQLLHWRDPGQVRREPHVLTASNSLNVELWRIARATALIAQTQAPPGEPRSTTMREAGGAEGAEAP
jgi:hypothetical protein